MRRILEYCDEQNYGPVASAKKISIKREEKELRVLSCTEQDRLCAYLVEHLNDRNLGILLCLFTGLRIGELCALTWDDMSISDRTVHVQQTIQRIQTEDPVSYTHLDFWLVTLSEGPSFSSSFDSLMYSATW